MPVFLRCFQDRIRLPVVCRLSLEQFAIGIFWINAFDDEVVRIATINFFREHEGNTSFCNLDYWDVYFTANKAARSDNTAFCKSRGPPPTSINLQPEYPQVA